RSGRPESCPPRLATFPAQFHRGVLAVITSSLVVLHVLFSAVLVLFVLLHRGTSGGLSDMFGGGGGGLGGSAVVEKNLDRLTVFAALGFTLTTIALGLRL
ncbi:MAG: preprotein translocase subunit SecG, partial [Glaciecola sp.]